MKTKQILMLTLLFLGFSLAREAQAFYNPSTGRWLSRDPNEEDGGLNLFSAVGNDFINGMDLLGCVNVRFEVVRGRHMGGWAGEWGSPAKFATEIGRASCRERE